MSRESIIDIANGEVGVTEVPPNSKHTKYGDWYGLNGAAWCGIFVSWVYNKAGYPLGKIDTSAGYHYCPSALNHFKADGEITDSPQPGDIVFYDWNGDGISDHTGIFNGWNEDKTVFQAYEGNTALKSDVNGGQVMLRNRKPELVMAFVSPNVLGSLQSELVKDETLNIGKKNSAVVQLQKMLHALQYSIVVDGSFGVETQTVVIQFQNDHSLPPNGIVTPSVFGAIQHSFSAAGTQKAAVNSSVNGVYLQQGAAGNAVVMLQKALNKAGSDPAINEDGVFGMNTLGALKRFQALNGLVADGIAGPSTFGYLGIKTI